MSLKLISERHPVEVVQYRHNFTLIGEEKGNGYSFPCHADGSLMKEDENYNYWKDNYERCLQSDDYIDEGVEKESYTYTEPAIGKCSCGENITLSGDVQCPNCGQWYNIWGQSLKEPRF